MRWYIVIYGFSVTLVTAKKQKLLWGVRVRAREKKFFWKSLHSQKAKLREREKWLSCGQQRVAKSSCCDAGFCKKNDVSFYWKRRVVLLKTTCRFVENNVSFCWKQRVVLLKTTCRFVENNVSFYWKQRVVLLKTTCCLNRDRRERVINIPVLWEKSVGASAQRRWKSEVFGHVSGKAYFCTA